MPPTPRLKPRPAAPIARAACGVGLLLLAAATLADERVLAFSAHYEGKKRIALFTATARAEIALRRSARFIVYTMDSTVSWAMIERSFRDCSVIQVDGDRMLPLEYLHLDASDPRLDVRTRFDWADNRATTTLGTSTDTTSTPIGWPTWDPMSFQVALISLAQRRRPGERETHPVIERGVLKPHQVTFSGALPLVDRQPSIEVHEVVSQKEKGKVVLQLWPEQGWRPFRVSIDDVTIELTGNPGPAGPGPAPDGPAPRCAAEATR